jgi:SEC-C motif-containing protein
MASPCPCGSDASYDACCLTVHRDPAAATTAEQLMRARYSAFVKHRGSFLLQSWHPATRPAELDLDERVEWVGLDVVSTERGGPTDRRGVVEFRARHTHDGRPGELHEVSRFKRHGDVWVYVRGRATWS